MQVMVVMADVFLKEEVTVAMLAVEDVVVAVVVAGIIMIMVDVGEVNMLANIATTAANGAVWHELVSFQGGAYDKSQSKGAEEGQNFPGVDGMVMRRPPKMNES